MLLIPPAQIDKPWRMCTGPADAVNSGIVLRQQVLTHNVGHRSIKLLADRRDRSGELFRHHVFGRGVDQIAHQVDRREVIVDELPIAARVNDELGGGGLRRFVAIKAVGAKSPADRGTF